jgi:hypothetical protein
MTALHPEVLWAQRSSDSDESKVRLSFARSNNTYLSLSFS